MKKRALISVSDKTGVVDAAKRLSALGYEIISTGGTEKALKDAGLTVINVSDITGFPECLDGRVKTLHPKIHAGLLAERDKPEHMERLAELGIDTIDVLIVNLYPFKKTVMKEGVDFADAVENIDIGGPAMIRAAAKNYKDVVVLVDAKDYDKALSELENGGVSLETKKYLMYKVFAHTAVYDSLISNYLREKLGIAFPEQLTLAYEKVEELRYGENPHQRGALYGEAIPAHNSLISAKQLNGKQLSYNNINDANGAIELLKEFEGPAVVAVKHANPCGVAVAESILEAYKKAYDCDPVSIYGGIVAANREIGADTAAELVKIFLEIVIAPSFTEEALEILKKKPNLRVLAESDIAKPNPPIVDFKKCYGGLIIQDADQKDVAEMKVVTKNSPTEAEIADMLFAMKVVKHCKSNAIVVAKGNMTLGIGTGQTNRIWAASEALSRSKDAKGAVLASDAFFPFNDCVQEAAKYGISAIIQPGGSVRDSLSIEECDNSGIAMIFTSCRHFKH
jgi:phosphoribosylaminoimidazolecarboxamide formyltransferase/IMP cyclohydrolase